MTRNAVILLAGLAATFALLHKRAVAFGLTLDQVEVQMLASEIINRYRFSISPEMVVRIAWIESHFDASASRYEPHLQDASTGLMQTLLSTARWLATDMGYSAYVPTMADLMDTKTSIYFGAAYLDYLSRYRGKSRSEEWIVRAYNGGPGHSTGATNAYWQKYLKAKGEVG